jgi:tellurite resistance protein
MSGIDYEELEQTLSALGLGRQSYRALMLLPLVYVAWADGKMERVEVERIREFARERLHLSQETANALDQWLRESPSRRYVEDGLRGLLGVALDEGSFEVELDELPDLILHAEAIARATADAFDDPSAVTPEEEEALAEIARLLEVDGGSTWKTVLDAVRSQRSPTGT